METKSRYEVIADLERQKRELIREKDELDDNVKVKEREVLNLKRTKEDESKLKENFALNQKIKEENLKREQDEFDFKIKNAEEVLDREISDAKEDLEYYKTTIEQKKKTVDELIVGVNESLERFGKLQSK